MLSICLATSKFVLGSTFGVLRSNISEESANYIDGVHNLSKYGARVVIEPPFLRRFVKTKNWKKALKAQDETLMMGAKIIQAKMSEIDKMSHEELENTDKHDFLTFILTKGGLKMPTVVQNTVDLLSAGIDTSAFTLLCVLYCVATHPDIQVRLREEITSVVGDSVNVTPEHIHRLTLLKNCIKESQRLHPIVPMHGRIVQSDVVLSGYKVPSGTLVMIPTYACSRHPGNFYQPDDFIPDRWLEDDVSRFGSLPFSFGARTCIGRRVAELVIRIALTQIVRRFDLSYLSTEPIHLGSQKLLILPDRPVILGLKDAKA
jgi:cytochrome P450